MAKGQLGAPSLVDLEAGTASDCSQYFARGCGLTFEEAALAAYGRRELDGTEIVVG